jgi:hypothetical protein
MSWTEVREVDSGITIEGVGASITVTEAPKPKKVKIKTDPVNSPEHYKVGGIETIDFIEAKKLGYNLGNVVKYITRSDLKGDRLENLKKAQWYLNREIKNEEVTK